MTAERGGLRAKRVAEAVRARVTELLARDVADPVLAGVVVTSVELPDDLGVAWIKVRQLVEAGAPNARERVVQHLERVSGRLRRGLGPVLRLKRVPELRFAYDEGADAAGRVEALLAEIAAERKDKDG